jgi:hypothetical protein
VSTSQSNGKKHFEVFELRFQKKKWKKMKKEAFLTDNRIV